jgi:uncharacterized protein
MALLSGTAVVIGILLGLLGGGGSILTVPVLVYLADSTPKSAIVTSLVVVCITSAITVLSYALRKMVCWKTGITFGLAGMLGAYSGGRLAAFIPDPILLVLFAIVMLLASIAMLRNTTRSSQPAGEQCREDFCPLTIPVAAILFDGVLVGLVTGLIGVGGGFLLVPALTLLAGLPIQAAIGTSLFIIVLQSLAALAGHADHMNLDLQLTGLFTLCAIVGSFIGSSIGKRIPSRHLKPGFGIFVFLLGCFLLYQEISVDLLRQIEGLLQQYKEFFKGALTIVITLLLYRLWSWLHWNKPS